MSTVTKLGEDNGEYGQHSLRFDPRAGRGMAEGHIAKGTFCLGHMNIPLMSFGKHRESAYLLTVSSVDDPDHCIEIILNEDDFTHAVQQAILDRMAERQQFSLPDKRPE